MKKITGLVMACAVAFALNALIFDTGKTEPPESRQVVASLPPLVTVVAGITSVPPPTWAVPARSLGSEIIIAAAGDAFLSATSNVVIADVPITSTSNTTVSGQDLTVLRKEMAQMGATLAAGMA